MPKRSVENFISHWKAADLSENQISQPFLIDLCELLEVPQPDNRRNGTYTFEFHVKEIQPDDSTKDKRIDLYKRGCFILESKKFEAAKPVKTQLELAAERMGAVSKAKKSAAPVRDTDRWDDAMLKALAQAKRYKDALPPEEPNPPFLLVVDVGSVIEVRADFSLTGRAYQPFPDPLSYRIRLEHLADEKIRQRLKLIWTNPQSLDPSKRSAEVTREVARHLAELAKSFENDYPPRIVAEFLTRCLFCMFAEDVGLLPNAEGKQGFTELLNSLPPDGTGFQSMLSTLFKEMNEGRSKGSDVSVILRRKLLRFNGGIFADNTVLPVNATQLGILKSAAALDWRHVEPAIFGTLLERALGGENERRKLGAHFTPRSYVERLVFPTVIEPLRAEWENVRAAAVQLGKRGEIKMAREEINRFHERLCNVKVLDPACGSGNFLYVALEHLKRLEGEVMEFAGQFGESFKLEMTEHTVDPHQFLGLEINPRAVSIAELVLWIGYLQWHFRTRGQTIPAEPVLKNFRNIQCRDAVLEFDGEPEPERDEAGNVRTIWDRRSTKRDSLTGRDVPDETKRVPVLTYKNPRPAAWPQADFIVGNPPFIGNKRMREDLGDGYAETLRRAYPEVSETADFVLYWWHKAAELARTCKADRFGLITTNSLRQTFARRVVQHHFSAKPQLSLIFAIPDHPWVDTEDGAAVRIAMTVGKSGKHEGELWTVRDEKSEEDGSASVKFDTKRGKIAPDLTIGTNVGAAVPLKANANISFQGMNLVGDGFRISSDQIAKLGFDLGELPLVIKPYQKGKALVQGGDSGWVIDCFGLDAEELRQKFPSIYQYLLLHVKPERDQNNRASRKRNWWLFGEPVGKLRAALVGIGRYIATIETSKFKPFVFVASRVIPDHKLYAIATSDAFVLGVLSSRIHRTWAIAAGGTLEDRPTWTNTTCFLPFPFPMCGEKEKARIRDLAEALDAHRKQVQRKHGITLTGLYNVLEKVRDGKSLSETEKLVHDRGLVSVLKSLHDDLDSAVSEAYGWPSTLTGEDILERLVALNAARAEEEKRGVIHWLRPEHQTKGQQEIVLAPDPSKQPEAKSTRARPTTKIAWPKSLPARVQAVEAALHSIGAPITATDLAKQFVRAKPADVEEILKTLETLGRARSLAEGKFTR